MTSVAAYDYRGNTVAFVGTRNGKLKKVGITFFLGYICQIKVNTFMVASIISRTLGEIDGKWILLALYMMVSSRSASGGSLNLHRQKAKD